MYPTDPAIGDTLASAQRWASICHRGHISEFRFSAGRKLPMYPR